MAEEGGNNIIIVKKVKKAAHSHHGGAWKVAYADFVTAMMAFFLLLWLLNATTDEQKKGIADYFSPASLSRRTSGAGGVMGGTVIAEEGALTDQTAALNIAKNVPSSEQASTDFGPNDGRSIEDLSREELDELMARREQEQFDEAARTLRQAIEAVPDLKELAQNIIIDHTPEGMRIQIVDQHGKSMFPLGQANMFDHTRKLMDLVADAISRLPQKIAIKGHTDAAPFVSNTGYSNWELSTDRANASRRALIEAGIDPSRIDSVAGRAAQELLTPENPYDPRNRRISIILLREIEKPG
ncbi:MAG: flagellar motor protein MotB [Kiloniellales bacterium]|nr:flagellar motor protein MotB [Kiloniellales bacterium]